MPTDTKRSKMVHVYTPSGGDYRIEVERETRRAYDNGDSIPLPDGDRLVRRLLSEIASDTVPGGPVTITTYDDLRILISECARVFAEEDELLQEEWVAAEAARIAALPDP
jgi:hypothetical protein